MNLLNKFAAKMCAAFIFGFGSASVFSADLTIQVSGVRPGLGQVGCALFKSAEGFPMDTSRAAQVWVSPATDPSQCEFKGVEQGQYAVSVNQDINSNRIVDTNLLGIPTEAWGVSNNARPMMRAPKWSEAVFSVTGEGPTNLSVRIK